MNVLDCFGIIAIFKPLMNIRQKSQGTYLTFVSTASTNPYSSTISHGMRILPLYMD